MTDLLSPDDIAAKDRANDADARAIERMALQATLSAFDVRRLRAILAQVRGGRIGFDPARDARTSSKTALIAFLLDDHDRATLRAAIVATGQALVIDHEPQPVPHQAPVRQTVDASGKAEQLADLIRALAGDASAPVDRDAVLAIVSEAMSELEAKMLAKLERLEPKPRELIVKVQDHEPVNVGIQHKNFDLLLKAASARLPNGKRLNIWIHGPMGSGKTSAGEALARALGVKFYGCGALDTAYRLSGFRTATGETTRTPFREAWEHGGVFLFDEIDASSNAAILELNAALSNGWHAFPDGLVERHADCIIIAGANTAGLGGSLQYNGRSRLDGAFLDRFVFLDWPIDKKLETSMASDSDWLARVRTVRANISTHKLQGIQVSPRGGVYGEALLRAGVSRADAEAMALRKAMDDATWAKVR